MGVNVVSGMSKSSDFHLMEDLKPNVAHVARRPAAISIKHTSFPLFLSESYFFLVAPSGIPKN